MAGRDPEVRALLLDSLRLIVRAEAVLDELRRHQQRVAGFLERADRYTATTEQEEADGAG